MNTKTVSIDCKCGWFIESIRVADQVAAELIADRHESQDIRRPYRHETHILDLKEAA